MTTKKFIIFCLPVALAAALLFSVSCNSGKKMPLSTTDIVPPTKTNTPYQSPTLANSATITPTRTITSTHTVSPTYTISPTPINTPISPSVAGSNVQYYGRWNMTNPAQPRNGWGTTYMVAGFYGTSVTLHLSAWDVWFAYAIDDFSDHSTFTKFRVKNQSDMYTPVPTMTPYTITGLADTQHTIMIVRRNDGMGGVIQFNGLGLDNGKTMAVPTYAAPTRKMEFIGDSITCGSANEYSWSTPTPTPDIPCLWGNCIQNGDMAFGPQTARLLNAEWRTISRGGVGMYRNCNGCSPMNTMPEIYPFTYWETNPASPQGPVWNPATWQPDVIVIALGTNDSSQGTPDKTLFQAAYTNFLTTLRTDYPNAHIICTEPIPTWEGATQISTTGTYISEVVTNKADAAIHYMAFNNPPLTGFPLTSTEYANDSTHPLVSAHTKVANALVAWINANIMTDLVANHGW